MPSFYRITLHRRVAMLCRAIGPIFLYASQVWPPQHHLAGKVNSLQRHMVAIAARIPRYPGEAWPAFMSRRSRSASLCIESADLWWTRAWWKRALNWDAHCRRDLEVQMSVLNGKTLPIDARSCFAWPPLLLDWRGERFMQDRRVLMFSEAGNVWSQTGTRSGRARTSTRWHEGIAYASRLML